MVELMLLLMAEMVVQVEVVDMYLVQVVLKLVVREIMVEVSNYCSILWC